MPIEQMRYNPDVPGITACISCARRRLRCHTACPEFAAEHIVAIIAHGEARQRKQLVYDEHEVIKHRIREGLYE